MGSNRHTNTPSGSCTYSPSDRQSWSPPTQKLTKPLLILPPVVLDTGYVSLHINYVLQQTCREICVTVCVCVCMYLCATFFLVFFFLGEMCECVYLFRSLCACVFVFESSNVSEILQPCFIQWEVRGSSTNSSPNVLNELFWSDGCRASCSLLQHCHSAPRSPACLSQQPTISLPSHHQPHCHYGNCVHAHIQSVIEVRWGYSMESRVNCCPSDLVQEQNKC